MRCSVSEIAESDNLLLAVGAVFLVTWYGVTRFTLRTHDARGGPAKRQADHAQARAALAAEFEESPAAETMFPGGTVACVCCGAVYPAGVLYCECGAECEEVEEPDDTMEPPLLEDQPALEAEGLDELVCIHVAENHWKATLLISFLNNHDIPCATRGTTSSGPYQFTYGPMSEVRLYVSRQHAEIAERLLHTVGRQESQWEREE